jgi:hypothetical protein
MSKWVHDKFNFQFSNGVEFDLLKSLIKKVCLNQQEPKFKKKLLNLNLIQTHLKNQIKTHLTGIRFFSF